MGACCRGPTRKQRPVVEAEAGQQIGEGSAPGAPSTFEDDAADEVERSGGQEPIASSSLVIADNSGNDLERVADSIISAPDVVGDDCLTYFIMWGSRQTLNVNVGSKATVAELKHAIEALTSVPLARQKLLGFKPANPPDTAELASLVMVKDGYLKLIGSLPAEVDAIEVARMEAQGETRGEPASVEPKAGIDVRERQNCIVCEDNLVDACLIPCDCLHLLCSPLGSEKVPHVPITN